MHFQVSQILTISSSNFSSYFYHIFPNILLNRTQNFLNLAHLPCVTRDLGILTKKVIIYLNFVFPTGSIFR